MPQKLQQNMPVSKTGSENFKGFEIKNSTAYWQ